MSWQKFQCIIPNTPLRWFDIPLFHVDFAPPDFAGQLYFILGQGLGDHVNGFRVLIEIQKRFPQAVCIVYADLRWKELVDRLKNIEIRWYPKAKDILSKEGTNNPYDMAREEVRKDITGAKREAFLAFAHFPMPDRHARQESTLEAIARAIGLVLGKEVRPYLPLIPSDTQWASDFLAKNDFEKGKYAVIAPLSWPNKVWGKDDFSYLIDQLYQSFGLRTIIVSYPEIGSFTNEGAVCAYDLSLGQLAGILSFAGIYIGLDSGPSHMCAFFDVPMLILYIEKKVIPFEVRTLSPQVLLVVESFFNSNHLPSRDVVCHSLRFLLGLNHHKDSTPECLACGRKMDHVVAADETRIRLMCSCGLVYDRSISHEIYKGKNSSLLQAGSDTQESSRRLKNFWEVADIIAEEEILTEFSEVRVLLKHTFIDRDRASLVSGHFIWGFDALLYWMEKRAYYLLGCTQMKEEVLLTFSRKSHSGKERLLLPWESKKIYSSVSRYIRWYTFSRWADPKILVGIVKSMSELRLSKRERFACAVDAFKTEPNFRSFRWILKSLF